MYRVSSYLPRKGLLMRAQQSQSFQDSFLTLGASRKHTKATRVFNHFQVLRDVVNILVDAVCPYPDLKRVVRNRG
jgi:hypothetical protein